MTSPLPLFDPAAEGAPRILQLYQDLELYSSGMPPANSLFVLGRAPAPDVSGSGLWRDQVLIVDPPADVTTRFRLEGDVAALFTGTAEATGLPLVQSMPGGVAHLRVGEHFLDMYAQRSSAVVHLPAIGVTLGGPFGSDLQPPQLGVASDGSDELETLRLLACLLKAPSAQLYIPRWGTMCTDRLEAMARLAADVGYLHALRRVLPAAVPRNQAPTDLDAVTDALLPAAWRTDAAQAIHRANVHAFLAAQH